MKITNSNSNTIATDNTDTTTFLNCTTAGVWMTDDTGESTDDFSVEVIATSVRIKGKKCDPKSLKWIEIV